MHNNQKGYQGWKLLSLKIKNSVDKPESINFKLIKIIKHIENISKQLLLKVDFKKMSNIRIILTACQKGSHGT